MVYWIVWLMICIVLIAVFSIEVLPILFGYAAGAMWQPTDRGVKKSNSEDGIFILYEPSPAAAKYIKRYKISLRTQEDCVPTFVGEWATPVQSAVYVISAFNKYDRRVAKKRVREFPHGARLTRSVPLPPETDFISLSVRRIDGKKIVQNRRRRTLFYPLFALFVFAVAIDFATVVFVTASFLSRVLGGFTADALAFTGYEWRCNIILPALFVALILYIAALCILFRQDVIEKLSPYCERGYKFIAKPCRNVLPKLKTAFMWLRFAWTKVLYAISNAVYAVFHNALFRKVGAGIRHFYYACKRRFSRKKGAQSG